MINMLHYGPCFTAETIPRQTTTAGPELKPHDNEINFSMFKIRLKSFLRINPDLFRFGPQEIFKIEVATNIKNCHKQSLI